MFNYNLPLLILSIYCIGNKLHVILYIQRIVETIGSIKGVELDQDSIHSI